jgi:GNAT superfamily N-acetyltransferase
VIQALRPVAEQGVDVFAGLAIAEHEGQVVGAAWLQPQVGRTATLWPVAFRAEQFHTLAAPLAQHAMSAAAQLSTALAQTLLDSSEHPFSEVLKALDFHHLADLRYLMLSVPNRASLPAASPVRLDSPALAQRELFAQLIQTTYRHTLDCPGLEGCRHIDDVLEGYQTIGTHDPNLWFIAHYQEQPAGVLLLSPYPESRQWELVYMGVVPELRGHGIGGQILAQVRYLASQAGIEQVVLAVDAENHPALQMYGEAGFVEWAHRTAYIKSIANS